ncbi:SusC/RagA family TonB-linked outer membrane protein [Mangrovibacterium sp.]|uniref:SusC/RagA family TonB-linked outer membrane protein n=1 Tax=Mangrovibacterium sp. TaxID=1961364 RepID=UPI00356743FB
MKRNKNHCSPLVRSYRKTKQIVLGILVLLFWVATNSCFAQNAVKGIVTDSSTGESLPGVAVYVKGTSVGTVTNIDGMYSINASANSTIRFSFVGYTTQEIEISNRDVINVQLKVAVEELSDVVVVGYGTMKRSDLTGAVTSINEDALKAEVVNSLDQAIQGKASGVQVTQNSGSPSAATSIRIRGANSLRNNEPLYVIDGVPVNSDATNTTAGFDWAGGGNGQTAINVLSTINPADIVSIEILKDASSTAIYGSRGANGVVLVTTKKGKSGDAVIAYNFSYGVQTVAKFLDVMNLKEFAEYQNELAELGYIGQRTEFSDLSLVPQNGTDWQKELFRSAIVSEHHVSVSGGNEKTKYSISGGYKDQEGLVLGSDYSRITGRVNVSSQAKEWLNLGVNLSASRTDETINLTDSDDGVITGALLMSPYQEVRGVDGSWAGPNQTDLSAGTNPVAKATEINNDIVRTRILGNAYADITILPSLNLRTEFGTDLNFDNNYSFLPTYEWGVSTNTVAKSRRQFSNNAYWIQKNYLTFDKAFGAHKVKVMLGQESQRARYENLIGQRQDFVSNDIRELAAGGTDDQFADSHAGSNTQVSFFGRANYSYNEKYLLTATYRTDGSSKFGPNNKWGYFPSFALAWRATQEEFLKNTSWLDNLKVRAGWGQVGNDAIGNYSYGSSLQVRATAFGGGFLLNNIPNPNVKWETTTQVNIGFDLAVLENRIEFVAEFYKKFTKDMLLVQPVPDYLGTLTGIGQGWQGIQPPYSNLGEMENTGIEFTLSTINISKPDFKWSTTLTFSKNKNKITSLGLDNAALYRKVQWYDFVTKTAVGKPVGQFYGYVVEGIFQTPQEVASSPVQKTVNELNGTWAGDIKYKDINEDDVIDDLDRTYIGDPNPDFTFGFINSFNYKNFDLAIYTNGSYGNDVFNFQRIRTEGMTNLYVNQLKTVTNRWTPTNTETNMPRLVQSDPNQNARISDRYIEDGSFLRISNITLGYQLPTTWLSKTPVKSFRVYGKIQNLHTFTKYSGYDPEVGSFNQDALLTGVDNGRFPLPRTFMFGVNVTL